MTFTRTPTYQPSPAVRKSNRPEMLTRALKAAPVPALAYRYPARKWLALATWILLAGCAAMPFLALAWAMWRAGR